METVKEVKVRVCDEEGCEEEVEEYERCWICGKDVCPKHRYFCRVVQANATRYTPDFASASLCLADAIRIKRVIEDDGASG